MDLVIQGLEIFNSDLRAIAKLAGAEEIENINQQAFRLRNADASQKQSVQPYCENAKLDYAYVPADQKLANFGLVVMDMDSTLITIECIDEIADMLNIKPRVAEITASAMRGEIDFAESLTRRVALLRDLHVDALQRVYDERLRLSPGAEAMLKKMSEHGIKSLLVSGGFTFFTDKLKSRLGLAHTASNVLEVENGKLTGRVLGKILDAQGKADMLNQVRTELGLAKEQVIAIGDGANDLKMMAQAGISVAYHAKPVVREQATYALNHMGLDGVLNLFTD